LAVAVAVELALAVVVAVVVLGPTLLVKRLGETVQPRLQCLYLRLLTE
jgi:hypothetical protein